MVQEPKVNFYEVTAAHEQTVKDFNAWIGVMEAEHNTTLGQFMALNRKMPPGLSPETKDFPADLYTKIKRHIITDIPALCDEVKRLSAHCFRMEDLIKKYKDRIKELEGQITKGGKYGRKKYEVAYKEM